MLHKIVWGLAPVTIVTKLKFSVKLTCNKTETNNEIVN
jgi:hypothetical protein